MIYLVIIALLIILIFPYLMYQSKKPSGFVGLRMMKIWNRAYLPMVSARSISWIIRSDL